MKAKKFDEMEFTPLHKKIMFWGSGGPFLDGYILVIIGLALEQLIPEMQLDANWIGLVGASTGGPICRYRTLWLHRRPIRS